MEYFSLPVDVQNVCNLGEKAPNFRARPILGELLYGVAG